MTDHPHPPFELRSQRLGALPVVDLFLERIGLGPLLARYLPAADRRVCLPAAVAIGLLVRNPCLAREPLYGLAEWAERLDPARLGLGPGEARLLNDDRVGRALDQLFDASSRPCSAPPRSSRSRNPGSRASPAASSSRCSASA